MIVISILNTLILDQQLLVSIQRQTLHIIHHSDRVQYGNCDGMKCIVLDPVVNVNAFDAVVFEKCSDGPHVLINDLDRVKDFVDISIQVQGQLIHLDTTHCFHTFR